MIELDIKNMSDNEISNLIQLLRQELENRRILQDFIKKIKIEMLKLVAINKYGEEIRVDCALSIKHQQIEFSYKGTYHTIKYNQTKKGNYFILNNIRHYFKVFDTFENKWIIDCNCF